MNKAALEMLEFPKVTDILAEFGSFSVSKDLALNLKPSNDPQVIKKWLRESSEARRLCSLRPNFFIGPVSDVRELVKGSSKGRKINPKEFLAVKDVLAASRNVRKSLKTISNEIPFMWKIADGIIEMPELERQIEKCININGEIVDSASEQLQSLRLGIRQTRQQLMDRLDSILKSRNKQLFIQEAYITERNNRYVLPVKSEFKKDIHGIVHDVSNTGATIFIEPFETVEIGNEYRQLEVGEKQEIEHILSDLSLSVGKYEVEITDNVEILGYIDLLIAKVKFSEQMEATEPGILDEEGGNGRSETRSLRLIKAKHPLLKGKAVPLTVEIGQDFNALVITGPNAGGKTVALKTIGLLALMAQSGIPIPASEESVLPVFSHIFADIGDQQSIEQTLSTFSWHMTNIIHILRQSDSRSLVLLDELGISTDPEEGSALARSILLELLSRKTMVVATTHYNDLKVFAHVTPGIRNASLDFDPISLMPTYTLTMGIPGRSNALSIASRLGLPEQIIENARSMINKSSDETERLLSDLMKEKLHYEQLLTDTERERGEITGLKAKLTQEGSILKEKERKLLTEFSDTLISDTAELRRQMREVESDLRKNRKRENIERAKSVIAIVQKKVDEKTSTIKDELASKPDIILSDISPGDIVRLQKGNVEGDVVSIDIKNKQIEIRVGKSKIVAGLSDINEVIKSRKTSIIEYPVLKKRRKTFAVISSELDLRGKRADEVSSLLDRFLNDAFLANLEKVRIIHGYATGTVRQIVRGLLAGHELVASFQPGDKDEGGDGVTVAFIKI